MDREYTSLAFLLDVFLFWRPVDKFYFIINLDHMMKREEIQWRHLDKCLNILQKKYSYDWVLAMKRDPVLKSIFKHTESSCLTNSYASVVRYCFNVYCHYNDNITLK
ncbi:hypothetical protein Gogos_022113, partial [Gossypium gossypioides]|nr:hypothetical protein [Gossypium gossypioides]